MAILLSALSSCTFVKNIFANDQDEITPDINGENNIQVTPESPKYTINFNFGDATLPDGFEESITVNEVGEIELLTPSKEGYDFLGWYVNDIPFSEIDNITEDMTLSAKWEIKKVTVTFQNFIGETVKVETIDWGTAATAPEVDGTAQGMPFLCWSSDISCVKEDITVKPIYDYPSYTVTFDVGSASAVADQKIYMGECPVKPEDPYKAGYTLEGWYLEQTHENEYKFDTALDAEQ